MITNSKIADTLDAAADLYQSEQVEWCQGAYHRGDFDIGISMCASQALRTVCGERLYADSGSLRSFTGDLDVDLFRASLKALDLAPENKKDQPSQEGFLINWNDQRTSHPLTGIRGPVHSKQEVIDLFKDKAKELRNQA